MLTVGSLFSGIGGFDLGLERAGMRVIWQSEIDPYASAVLRKHWPTVPNLGDIRGIDEGRFTYFSGNDDGGWDRHFIRTDVICGGFPCQPFSSASSGRAYGESHDSYLWPEMLRVIQVCEPTWVCCENVTHLDRMALEQVCSDLEGCGYEVQTLEIPACAVDADHIRSRLWILGYADGYRKPGSAEYAEASRVQGRDSGTDDMGAEDGLPNRMDRLRCLGNAIVPQIAEIIGRAIVSAAAIRKLAQGNM